MECISELQNHGKYRKVKGISRGGFGFYDLFEDQTTKQLVAIKFVERGDRVTKRTERQVLQHQALVHPHIVQLIEVFLTEDGLHLAIVMEYVEGTTLLDHVKEYGRLEEDEARWYFQQIMIALDYLHRKEIASRDMKLQNILLEDDEARQRPLLKVTGFGHAKHERFHSAPASLVGTAEYLSPEVIRSQGKKAYNGRAADVWAVGVCLFRMVVGSFPFERKDDYRDPQIMNTMADRICKGDYHIPSSLHPDLVLLLQGMLQPDPKQRISLPQILQNPWFTDGLPAGVLDMNSRLPAGPEDGQGQDVFEVKEILEKARQPPDVPVHLWDDSAFIDDHQFHGLDDEELQEYYDSARTAHTSVPPVGIAT
jgi:serine/threonine-protein kinase SRK2